MNLSTECFLAYEVVIGVISVIGFLDMNEGKQPSVLVPTLVNAVTVRGVRGGSKHQLEQLVKFVENNKSVDSGVGKVFNFDREGVVEAYKFVEAGKHIGKVAISISTE